MWMNVLKTYQKLISLVHTILVGTLQEMRPPGRKGVMTLGMRTSGDLLWSPDERWDSTKCKEFILQLTSYTYGVFPSANPHVSASRFPAPARLCTGAVCCPSQLAHANDIICPDRAAFRLANRWTEAQSILTGLTITTRVHHSAEYGRPPEVGGLPGCRPPKSIH